MQFQNNRARILRYVRLEQIERAQQRRDVALVTAVQIDLRLRRTDRPLLGYHVFRHGAD